MPSAALLQSPDLKLLKLGSPELERLIINNNGFIPTPTPGGHFPSFTTAVSTAIGGEPTTTSTLQEDKDRLAKGFIEALQKLQEQDGGSAWETGSVGTASNSGESVASIDTYSQHNLIPSAGKIPISSAGPVSTADNKNQRNNAVGVITPVIQNRSFLDDPDVRSTPPPAFAESTKNVTSFQPQILPISTVESSYINLTRSTDVTTAVPASRFVGYKNDVPSPKSSMAASWLNQGPLSNASSAMMSTTNSPLMLDQIKMEDDSNQIVPSMSVPSDAYPTDPINLVQQEHIKHERKKLRNRLAAQRCRKRKIEREDTLKEKVKELKDKNADLSDIATKLRMKVCELKEQVMQHVKGGCNLYIKDDSSDVDITTTTSTEYQVL